MFTVYNRIHRRIAAVTNLQDLTRRLSSSIYPIRTHLPVVQQYLPRRLRLRRRPHLRRPSHRRRRLLRRELLPLRRRRDRRRLRDLPAVSSLAVCSSWSALLPSDGLLRPMTPPVWGEHRHSCVVINTILKALKDLWTMIIKTTPPNLVLMCMSVKVNE